MITDTDQMDIEQITQAADKARLNYQHEQAVEFYTQALQSGQALAPESEGDQCAKHQARRRVR